MVVEIPPNLPVGFRFHPTDVELINSYLRPKIAGRQFRADAIAEVDFCKLEPWELPLKSAIKSEDRMWWFLCQRDYKNPSTRRVKRTTKTGFWKITGPERMIRDEGNRICIGRKRTLVFHSGPTPGRRTNWVMQEIYLDPNTFTIPPQMASYVICKLKKKGDEKAETPEGEITLDSEHLSPPPAIHLVDIHAEANGGLFTDVTEELQYHEFTEDDILWMSPNIDAGPSSESPEEIADPLLIIEYQDERALFDDSELETMLKRPYFSDAPGGSDTEAEGYFRNKESSGNFASQSGTKRVRQLRVSNEQSETLQTRVTSQHFVQEHMVHSPSNSLTKNKHFGEIDGFSPVTPPPQCPKHVAVKAKPVVRDQKTDSPSSSPSSTSSLDIYASKAKEAGRHVPRKEMAAKESGHEKGNAERCVKTKTSRSEPQTSKWRSVFTFVETSSISTCRSRPPSEYWLNTVVGSVLLLVFVGEVAFAIF